MSLLLLPVSRRARVVLPIVARALEHGGLMSESTTMTAEAFDPTAESSAPQSTGGRLGLGEKVGYAVGDTASNFFWKTGEFFLMIFYTDAFGLSPSIVATMLVVTRIFDAINDPFMGIVADRTKSRWGRFRPYMLWGAPALGAAAVFTFSTPDLGDTGKVVYAYVTYTLLMVMYTVVNVPYSALMGVMTDNSLVRTTLSSFRFVGAFVCALFVQTFTMDLVRILGAGDDARGWQLTMMLYAVAATLLFWVSFATTRERIEPPKAQRSDVRADGRALLSNGPWLVLFFLGVFVIIAFWMRGGTTAYYFKYYVKDESQIGTFFFWAGISTLAGIFVTAPLSKLFGKRNLYMALMGIAGVLTCAFYFVKPDNLAAMYTLNILAAFVLGPTAPLVFAMYADTADYAEYTSGRRLTGLVFAGAMFGMKVGSAVAGWVMGMTLSWVGYVANDVQTDGALHGIVLMMSLFPGIICVTAAALVYFYRLDQPMMDRVERELKARRAQAA